MRFLIVALIGCFIVVFAALFWRALGLDDEQLPPMGPRPKPAAVRPIVPPTAPTSTTTTTTAAPVTTTTAVARTAPTVRAASAEAPSQPRTEDGAWSCGGDLPPCWVLDRENPDRDLTVYNGGSHHEVGYTGGNPEGDSTASGKWQFVRDTWDRFGGYLNAADAPWQVQDEKARQLWAGGRGCTHWAAC